MTKIKLPLTIVVILSLTLIIFRFIDPPTRMLTWDVFGYYLYLPAKFIYHDLTLANQQWLHHLMETYNPTATLYQASNVGNGNWVMKYSMGLAILYAPFFLVAHLLAGPLGFPADGLSLPYQYILTIGGLFYAIIGLIYLTKILRHFFDQRTSILVLIILFFGTNYFQLTAFDGTLLSHNFLFTLYAILTYYTIQWHRNPQLKYAVYIGLSIGFITLIRPSEIVCVFIPLLWYPESKNYFKGKIKLVKSHLSNILIVIFFGFLVILPQLIYWKYTTGHLFYYSYRNPGEGLDLMSPHTMNFLFSFRKGWLVYTPIMIFSLIGFYYLYRKSRPVFLAILVFIVADIYLISSWTTWWYAGGSFSSRSLVPAYVLLAIPLGCLVDKIKSSFLVSKIIFSTLAISLMALNLFQTWQFENGIISKERMTKAYYFATFGKTSVSDSDRKLLLVNRSVNAFQDFTDKNDYRKKLLYENYFDDQTDTLTNTNGVFVMDENHRFSPGIDIKYKDLTQTDHAWIRASAKIFIPENYDEESPLMVTSFHYKGKAYKYRATGISSAKIKRGAWNTLQVDYLTPEVRTKDDNLKVYLWYRGNQRVLVDQLTIYIFEPK